MYGNVTIIGNDSKCGKEIEQRRLPSTPLYITFICVPC